MKNYLTQKIKKPETPQQMLGRALKQLRESKPAVKNDDMHVTGTPFDELLRPLCDYLAGAPQNQLIGNLNYVIDNLNGLGTDYTIILKTKSKK